MSFLLSILLASQAISGAGASKVKALVGGRLIDGYGGAPLEQSVILIEGDRIKAVGRVGEITVPPGAEWIATEGMSVLPGLWDMHVHLMIVGHSDYEHWDKTYLNDLRRTIMPAAARQLLLAGVTSARDLGAPLEDVLAIRAAIERGEMPGPTLYVSGPFIQHAPYPGTEAFRWGVSGAEDARAKVRRLAQAGVNVIKLIDQDQMTMEEVEAVVDEAHRNRLPVAAHAHRVEEIKRGLAAGVDCFEHTGLGTSPEYPDEVFARMKLRANTLFWTPTITPLLLFEYTRDNPERLDDPRWHEGLPKSIVDDVRGSLRNVAQLGYCQLMPQRRPTLKRKFEQLRASGAVLMIGTDSGVPLTLSWLAWGPTPTPSGLRAVHSDSTWRELDYWVSEFGISPMEAIRAATYWPAVHMKVDRDVGTIAPGKIADVIAVRGDVLRHVSLLQNVELVVKRGVRVK